MKRFGNLYPTVTDFHHLYNSAHWAVSGKKNKFLVQNFFFNLESELLELQSELLNKSYQPEPYHLFFVSDPKVRLICAPDFRDQVVHHSLCSLLEPIFERSMIHHSYACRVGKGSMRAIEYAKFNAKKYMYFLKLDVKKFFHSVNHELLTAIIARKIKDKDVLQLIEVIVRHQPPSVDIGTGLPIGNLTSQHFANIYLNPLDHFITEELKISGYLRYMDDLLLFSDDKSQLWNCYYLIQGYLSEKLRLSLKDKATLLAPVRQGIPYLGFRIFPGLTRIKRQNLQRSKKRLRLRKKQYEAGIITEDSYTQSIRSILGFWDQGQTRMLRRSVLNLGWGEN